MSTKEMPTIAKWIVAIATLAYLSFPVFSGAWFDNRIECAYPWSEAIKQGLSLCAYMAAGTFAWRKLNPDVLTDDGAFALYASAVFLGVLFAANVIHKCLW